MPLSEVTVAAFVLACVQLLLTHLRMAGRRLPTKAARLNVRKHVIAEKYFSGTAKFLLV